jgi:hypothetical protein
VAAAAEERIAANKQRSSALLHDGRNRHIDRLWAVCLQNKELSPNTLRRNPENEIASFQGLRP